MPKSVSNSDNDKQSFFDITKLGYVAAGLSSFLTAWFSIGENHAKEIYERKLPEFMKIEQDRQEANTGLHSKGEMKYGAYLKERFDIERVHAKAYSTELKKVGIISPFHKLLDLKVHQQVKVFLTVAAVMGIAIGTTTTLGKNHRLKEELKREEAGNNPQIQRG